MQVTRAHMTFAVCKNVLGWLNKSAAQCGLAALLIAPTLASAEPLLPSKAHRMALFDALVGEIERLDGDGLINRHTRPESWRQTKSKLREAAATATSPVEYGQVFHRLRGTYPNFHAGVSIAEAYRGTWMQSDAKLPVLIRAETVKPSQTRPPLRIAQVDGTWARVQPPDAQLPLAGDVIIAMDERPADEWLRENEIFCKQPTLGQCPIEFHRNLARGLLFWHPEAPLTLELLRNGGKVRVIVNPLDSKPALTANANVAAAASASNTPSKPASWCDPATSRAPDGFTLSWQGTMVCVFENASNKGVQIWRIQSFASEAARTYDAKPGKHKSVNEEAADFYANFWRAKAPDVKHLIIDVAGNSGGETVVPWLRLLLNKPFQSSFVRFKRTRDFDELNMSRALFWNSKGALFQMVEAMKFDVTFERTAVGDWLPAIPQFCAADNATCATTKHLPEAHKFSGRISLVIDPFCNSACANFAQSMRTKTGARIVGLPDTADTAFSRLRLHFGFDKAGMPIVQVEDDSKIAMRVGTFTVAATLSTEADGKVISGQPQLPDLIVERLWHQDGDQWAREAIKAALR